MPTYDYKCDSCGNTFEAFQKMSDPVLKECPKCGKPVHRLLSASIGINFKGSGFYVNDSKSSQAGSACSNCKKCS
ncbi:MAG: FmdB family transcriptional regulator [Spirochaetaceae bacterium]|nr:FmdB family transcriptional regulator [Spirochaetaceae bacterium]MBO7484616.1 FmdB family transcriptional regulator [Spirochaetaceae bacterium]